MNLAIAYRAGGDPLSSVDVHVSDQVVCDGSPAVVLGRLPTEFDVLSSDFVRHEAPRFGGHVEHVDPPTGLEGAGLTGQSDGVNPSVAGAVGLKENVFLESAVNIGTKFGARGFLKLAKIDRHNRNI